MAHNLIAGLLLGSHKVGAGWPWRGPFSSAQVCPWPRKETNQGAIYVH